MSTIPETKVVIEDPEQASTNFFWTFESGNQIFNLQTTIRGILTYPQVQGHIKSAMEAMAHVQELGGFAKQVGGGYSKAADNAPIASASTLPMMGAPTEGTSEPTQPTAPAAPKNDGPLSFLTEKLSVSMTDGKKYFKIKGEQYKKFGVTVWPEVLKEIGVNPDAAESKEYDFKGWRAFYTLKDDGSGHPAKIVKLEAVAKV